MRVNVYAEEMTDRIEIITKEIDGHGFTGLRFYLELPATVNGQQYQAPFIHRPGDDDSSAVTFWGKRDLRKVLHQALSLLDTHYAERIQWTGSNVDEVLRFIETLASARRPRNTTSGGLILVYNCDHESFVPKDGWITLQRLKEDVAIHSTCQHREAGTA